MEEERITLLMQVFLKQLDLAEEAAKASGKKVSEIRNIVLDVLAGNEEITDADSANRLVKDVLEELIGEEPTEEETGEAVPEEAPAPRRPRRKGLDFKGLFSRVPLYVWIVGFLLIVLVAVIVLPFGQQKPSPSGSPSGQVFTTSTVSTVDPNFLKQKAVIQEAWKRIANSFYLSWKENGVWPRVFNAKIGEETIPQYLSNEKVWTAKFSDGHEEIVVDLLTELKDFFVLLSELDLSGKKKEAIAVAGLFQAKWDLIPKDTAGNYLTTWDETSNPPWPVILIEKIVGDQPIKTEERKEKNLPTPQQEPITLPSPKAPSTSGQQVYTGQGQSGEQTGVGQVVDTPTPIVVPTNTPLPPPPTATPVPPIPTPIVVVIPTIPPKKAESFSVPYYAYSAKMGGEKTGLNWNEAYSTIFIWYYSQTGEYPPSDWVKEVLKKTMEEYGGDLSGVYNTISFMPTPLPTQTKSSRGGPLRPTPTPWGTIAWPPPTPVPTSPNQKSREGPPLRPTPTPWGTIGWPPPTQTPAPPTPLPTWAPWETPVGRF